MLTTRNIHEVLAKVLGSRPETRKTRPTGSISEMDLQTFKNSAPEFQRKIVANLKMLEQQGLIDPISQILEPLVPRSAEPPQD